MQRLFGSHNIVLECVLNKHLQATLNDKSAFDTLVNVFVYCKALC